ncbi:MAG: dicarboxylate/amino acid:cation symporter [Xanthomonadaceae bacterium]|nr:dicarboxylate/amino acid:cation symporter [Xanthomonadaceae bacterium]
MNQKNLQPVILFVAVGLGIILGINLSPSTTQSMGLPGKLFIQVIKAIATPLLFFAIIDSFLTIQIRGKDLLKMFGISAINAGFAIIVALTLCNFFKPGVFFDLKSFESINSGVAPQTSLASLFEKMIPTSFVSPFVENNIFSIVILAVLFGFAIRSVRKDHQELNSTFIQIESIVRVCYRLLERILYWLTLLVPIAVLGITAKAVSEKGLGIFVGLSSYLALCVGGLLLQMFIVYQGWIVFYVKMPLRKFWSHSKYAIIHAFGVNSSLATLHLTLSATEKLGASPHASRIIACVGTNFNNDGILLYEAAAALFISQALGYDLSFLQQLTVMATCIVAALGVSGVPEAGIISLAVVLSANGLPTEVLPLLLTVDWFVARLRSVTNVMSDITGSLVLDHQTRGYKNVKAA